MVRGVDNELEERFSKLETRVNKENNIVDSLMIMMDRFLHSCEEGKYDVDLSGMCDLGESRHVDVVEDGGLGSHLHPLHIELKHRKAHYVRVGNVAKAPR